MNLRAVPLVIPPAVHVADSHKNIDEPLDSRVKIDEENALGSLSGFALFLPCQFIRNSIPEPQTDKPQ